MSDQNPPHEKLWMHGRHCQQQIPSVAWDALKVRVNHEKQPPTGVLQGTRSDAETRERTGDLQIFGLTLSQLSYRGLMSDQNPSHEKLWDAWRALPRANRLAAMGCTQGPCEP